MQILQAQLKRFIKYLRIRQWESRRVKQRHLYHHLTHGNFGIVQFSKFFALGICILGLTVDLGFGRLAAIEQIPQVTAVTSNSSVVQSLTNEPSQLVQLGKESYKAGQFANAITVWQKVLHLFTQRGDRLRQAVVLSNVALAYQQLGQWTQANQAIAQSITLLKEAKGKDGESSIQNLLADALNIQGSLQLAQGQAEQAFDTWLQATDIYQQAKDKKGVKGSTTGKSGKFGKSPERD
ncbi:tetratricopeptide repeat protein [Brasilonema sp. UFV-L1]|uniref:tetratricopeptide repeat protein n=1 Tax=Brasilonema sp. UFV-L1 TaxID=2234130 RepID=UPI002006DFEE|nr:tetratricopeptide repeat protein [Brasilonema sp. UFV-L1]